MSFGWDRSYECFVVLGDGRPWQRWECFGDAIAPAAETARGGFTKSGVRLARRDDGRGGGRRTWRNWAEHAKSIAFLSVQGWFPSAPACEREGVPPDLFIEVRDESDFGFGFSAVLAFAADCFDAENAARHARAFARCDGAPLLAHSKRAWGRDGWNPIDTALYTSVFRLGARAAKAEAVQPEWRVLQLDPRPPVAAND